MSAITTDAYIQAFHAANHKPSLSKWIYDHPTTVKVVQIVGAILGIAAISAAPFLAPMLGIAFVSSLGIVGGALLVASIVSRLFLKYITCASRDLSMPTFQEGVHLGGRLYYQGKIPILELNTEDPLQAGKAHGYLLGKFIYELKSCLDFLVHTLLRDPTADKIPQVMQQLKSQIPKEYLQEMQGISEGYNQWAQEAGVGAFLQLDEVLLLHLIPDSKHFSPGILEKSFSKEPLVQQPAREHPLDLVACTSLLFLGAQGEVIFGRNMDWCPFGQGGAASLIFLWKPKKVAALGVPGMIGVVSGWNQYQLAAAMNVCPGLTTQIQGMPAILFNRRLLEEASTIQEAQDLILRKKPLGPYHLTLADKEGEGACISFYQGEGGQSYIRKLKEQAPLWVLNWRYPESQGGYFHSEGRETLLKHYFEQAKRFISSEAFDAYQLVAYALQMSPWINSWITMHSLLFRPQSDEVALSWDNGYAASVPKEKISMQGIFG